MNIIEYITTLRKTVVICLLVVLIFNVSAYASETRKNSLMADDNILKDETNPYVYPSTILGFPNRLIVEYVGGTGYVYAYFKLVLEFLDFR